MPPDEGQHRAQELRRSAEEIIRETVRAGAVEPALALECIYYAREPDLVAILRRVAALSETDRLRVVAFLQDLTGSRRDPPDGPAGAR